MSSIGPELPSHLQKRKRTPEDDGSPPSTPSKVARANSAEIALADDSSDDRYGPSAGPAPKAAQHGPSLPPSTKAPKSSKPQPSIGPTMPPSNQDQIDISDEDEEDRGISSIGPSAPRRQIGPSAPPSPISSRPTTNPNPGSDSDSDDDYGPKLPSSTSSNLHNLLPQPTYDTAPAAPKRDDWMLAPPAPTSRTERDPTKLKARKFASGRAAAGNEAHAGGVSAIWTETPEEKAKRLRDAVLGRSEATGPQPSKPERVKTSGGSRADEEKIRSFTEQTRGKSLYEEHQIRKKEKGGDGGAGGKKKRTGDGEEEEEDDPSKRAFSWEKDMKSAGTISHSQRRELLNKSADFGGRFQKGSYL